MKSRLPRAENKTNRRKAEAAARRRMRQRPGLGGRRGGESRVSQGECGCSVLRWLLACAAPSKAVPAQVRVTGWAQGRALLGWVRRCVCSQGGRD